VKWLRAWISDPVALKEPEAGSKNSALPLSLLFPINSTLPFGEPFDTS
jgi:hypothetical protein